LQQEHLEPHYFFISELNVNDYIGYHIDKGNQDVNNVSSDFLQLYMLLLLYGSCTNEISIIKLHVDYNKFDILFMDNFLKHTHYGSFYHNGYKHYSWHYHCDFLNEKCIPKEFMNLSEIQTKIMLQTIIDKKKFKHISDTLTIQLVKLLSRCFIATEPKELSINNSKKQLFYIFLKENESFCYNDMLFIKIKNLKLTNLK
jgi:hypothetical protein